MREPNHRDRNRNPRSPSRPKLCNQVAGLRGPADVDAGGGGLDDLDAAAAQFLVGSGVDAVQPVRAARRFGELEVQRGVVLPGPERRVGRAAPEDKARAVRQCDDDILPLRCPGFVIRHLGDLVGAGVREQRVIIAQLGVDGSERRQLRRSTHEHRADGLAPELLALGIAERHVQRVAILAGGGKRQGEIQLGADTIAQLDDGFRRLVTIGFEPREHFRAGDRFLGGEGGPP